jgi:predicted porin
MFAKKNLVAAAALLALAGAAQADVKLYGMLDLSVGSYEGAHTKGDSTRTTKVNSGDMMTSYFGLAGSEDLGNGLKAEFTLESFLAPDTGEAGGPNTRNKAGGFWSRGSNVALSGGFGKVAIGQYDNPLFTSGYTYNPFGSSMSFSPTMRHLNYVGGTSITGVTGPGVGFDTGWVNSLTYESPVFGGFQAVGQYAPKETKVANTNDSYTLAGIFNAGPFSATLTYVKAGFVPANGTYNPYTAKEKVVDLGASYDFGVVKAFAQYTDVKDTTDDNKDKIYQLGVSVPVTDKASVMASFGQLKNKVTGASTSTKDDIFSVGYDYTLSKRTDVYGVFANNRQSKLESGLKHNF